MSHHETSLTVLREVWRKDDFAIVQCHIAGDPSRLVSVKTHCSEGELRPELTYRFYGKSSRHPRYGLQFAAQSFVEDTPVGEEGIAAYLRTAPGIGRNLAQQLVNRFGDRAIETLRETPEQCAAAVEHLSESAARQAASYLKSRSGSERLIADLMGVVKGYGVPRKTVKEIIETWGNKAAAMIRRNPYLLMQFPGIGFAKADKLYLDLGHPPHRLKRQVMCAVAAMETSTEGHVWFSPGEVSELLRKQIGVYVRPLRAFRVAKRAGMLRVLKRDGGTWIAPSSRDDAEFCVADLVSRFASMEHRWPEVASEKLSEHQAEKLRLALRSPIGLFIGSPGTGKTYSVARLVEQLLRHHPRHVIALAAPTGKAAVRMGQSLQDAGLTGMTPKTIHSLLGVAGVRDGEFSFNHNEMDPLPYRFIIIDEASMVDCELLSRFLLACDPGTHILFVGDVNQLPPVGYGAPLRDLVASGLPVGELTEIRRNAGSIVEACAAIRSGGLPERSAEYVPSQGKNLFHVAAKPEHTTQTLVDLIREEIEDQRIGSIHEAQVLVAVNEKSLLSRKNLNQALQRAFNSGNDPIPGTSFRVGDKVICLKNGSYSEVDGDYRASGGEVPVANGEQGVVLHAEPTKTIVRLESPRRDILIPRDAKRKDAAGCAWDLAYAISCHKSQGSEFPLVLVVLDSYPGARLVCSREWIYTAISRAKLGCFLVGEIGELQNMIAKRAIHRRKTFLKERLVERLERTKHARSTTSKTPGDAVRDPGRRAGAEAVPV